jgi:hypothetical protein
MKQDDTLIIRALLGTKKSIYRDIEIEASQSLYQLAQAIVQAFDFSFDHAFGFYTGRKPATLMREHPMYELFADMGEADPGVLGVKKTPVSRAFPAIDHAMTFVFDYGDSWHFNVSLKQTGTKLAKVRYPRQVTTRGEAPVQYADPDDIDDDDDLPTARTAL